MSDDFPESLLKDAVPPAHMNMAGRPVPPQPKARKKAAVKAQPARPANGKPDIHQEIEMVGKGTVKHGTASPYATGQHQVAPSAPMQVQDPDIPEDFDPFDVTPVTPPRTMTPQEQALRKAAALKELGVEGQEAAPAIVTHQGHEPVRVGEGLRRQVMGTEEASGQSLPSYLEKSQRISLELQDGTFTLPVIDVRESRLSVLLLLPLRDNATIFIPKPGTQMTLTYGKDGKSLKVYYPGTYVEIEELGAGFMTLIKADAEA